MLKEPEVLLRLARRRAEQIPGVNFPDDFCWYPTEKSWVLRCRISIGSGSDFVPSESEWFLLIPEDYPKGEVEVMPSKTGGIQATFPHQALNSEGPPDVPWRTGKLCIERPTHVLGNGWDDRERHSAEGQLCWVMNRTVQWLQGAAGNTLLSPGDPFELPILPLKENPKFIVAFREDEESFPCWGKATDYAGTVTLLRSNCNSRYQGASSFVTYSTGEVVNTPSWTDSSFLPKSGIFGLWLRLEALPIVSPWEFPRTWGQMKRCLGEDAWHDLLRLLKTPACLIRQKGDLVYLLLGAPVPERVDEVPSRMHWLALELPRPEKQDRKRWRRLKDPFWTCYERELFSSEVSIRWVRTENWAPDEISSRGRFPVPLRDMSIAVIGLGALGSPVAELLARSGIRGMFLVDHDSLATGNLVRHTLTYGDIGKNKALALREKLLQISSHLEVDAVPLSLQAANTTGSKTFRTLRDADVIVDCTSNDDVLDALANHTGKKGQILLSCSVNYGASRLFLYSGRDDSFVPDWFRAEIEPFLKEDHERYSEEDCPWEGVGCWHPVFPARADDMSIFAGLILKHLEKLVCGESPCWGTVIYEQANEEDCYCEIKRIYPEDNSR